MSSLLADGGGDSLRRPAATGDAIVPTAATPATVTLITTKDGRTFVADAGTAEGRQAIEQAQQNGGTLRSVSLPPRTASSKPGGSLSLPGSGTADLQGLVGSLLPKGDDLPGTGSGGDDDVDGLLEIDTGLIDGLLGDPVGTVTSIVQRTPTTVTSIVRSVPTTVTSVLDDATTTVSSVLAPVPLPTPTSAPSVGEVGQVVTTVVSGAGSVLPTTAPASPTSDPVCNLLVVC